MARTRQKSKGRRPAGTFAALPHSVFRPFGGEPAPVAQLSTAARALLVDLAMQYDGSNNGDLTAALSVLSAYGWNSKGSLNDALVELVALGFLAVTRRGGRKIPSLYALTWHGIDSGPHDEKPDPVPLKLWLPENAEKRDKDFVRRWHAQQSRKKSLPAIRTNVPAIRTNEAEKDPKNGTHYPLSGPNTAVLANSLPAIRTPL